MKTWTYNKYTGGTDIFAVVSAETVELAAKLLEEEISQEYLVTRVDSEDLIPLPTSTRKVRVLGYCQD